MGHPSALKRNAFQAMKTYGGTANACYQARGGHTLWFQLHDLPERAGKTSGCLGLGRRDEEASTGDFGGSVAPCVLTEPPGTPTAESGPYGVC